MCCLPWLRAQGGSVLRMWLVDAYLPSLPQHVQYGGVNADPGYSSARAGGWLTQLVAAHIRHSLQGGQGLSQYTLFIVLAPIALSVALAVVLLCWRYRSGPGVGTLMAVMLSVSGWLVLNTMELLARSPDSTLIWAKLEYIFIVSIPVLWISFALRYGGRGHWLRAWQGLVLWVIPSVTVVLACTNHLHGLMWAEFEFLPVSVGLAMMVAAYGPWFWINAAYSYLLIFFGAGLLGLEAIGQFRLYRQQAVWLLMGAVSPLILNLIYLSRIVPGFANDFSAIAVSLAGLFISIGMFRHRLFDLTPIARASLVDNLQDAVLVLDRDNRVVDMNPMATTFTGVQARDAIGKQASVLFAAWPNLVEATGDKVDVQTVLSQSADGTRRHYDLRISPLRDAGGKYTGRLVVLRDITVQRQVEAQLRHANAELQHEIGVREELIKDLDAFAQMVAHDLKNPLSLILGYSEMLLMDVDEGRYGVLPEWVPMVRPIARTARKMSRIVEEMLLLSSADYDEVIPMPLDMQSIVAEVEARLARVIEESGATITHPESWPASMGYAPWIEEVWANYLDNAIKYGGRPPRVELGAVDQGDGSVRFWVRDNGDGIESSLSKIAFDMRTRGENTKIAGHGLGLAIAKRIVEKLGGRVGVESAGVPGEGSTFSFTLPCLPGSKQS